MPVRASHTFAVWSAAAGDDARAVRAERHAQHRARVPLQVEQGRAGPRVPHLRRLVMTAGDDPRAVRAERHAHTPCPCAPSGRAGACPVRASHTFAVWSALPVTIRVPSGLNATLAHRPVCPFSSSRGVPVRASHTFAVLSPTAGDDPRAVRAERHAPHPARVPFQVEQGRAGPRVPHLRRPVLNCR